MREFLYFVAYVFAKREKRIEMIFMRNFMKKAAPFWIRASSDTGNMKIGKSIINWLFESNPSARSPRSFQKS